MIVAKMIMIGLTILAYVVIMKDVWKTKREFEKKYKQYKMDFYTKDCPLDILKPNAFFRMQNDGLSPCEPMEDIQYKDYLTGCSMFMEE